MAETPKGKKGGKKPAKKVTNKAGSKNPAKKKRAAKKKPDIVPDVIPMAEFVVVVNNAGSRAARLSAEARPTQFVQVVLDGKADKALVASLLSEPGRVRIIDIPESQVTPAGNQLRLDQVGLNTEVVTKMLSIMPQSTRPERDQNFLIEILRGIEALTAKHRPEAPYSVRQLEFHNDNPHGVLNAASLCRMVDDDEAFVWIKGNTGLQIGPAKKARLRQLVRVLRGYYEPALQPQLQLGQILTMDIALHYAHSDVQVAIWVLLQLLEAAVKNSTVDPLMEYLSKRGRRALTLEEFIAVVDNLEGRSVADLQLYSPDWTSEVAELLNGLRNELVIATRL